LATSSISKFVQQITALIQGLPGVSIPEPWPMAGGSYTKKQVVQVLNAYITAIAASAAAKTAYKEAVATAVTSRTAAVQMREMVHDLIESRLGRESSQLELLSLVAPPKPATLEVKSASAAKAQATRTARHTMGPVQKKAIKGTVSAPAAAAPEADAAVASASSLASAAAPTVALAVKPAGSP
jgi:hypothetical protein